jgi:hypothetical protein
VGPGDGVVVVGCVAGLDFGSFGVGDGVVNVPASGAGADVPGPVSAGAGAAGGVAGAAGRMITGPVDSGIVSGPL